VVWILWSIRIVVELKPAQYVEPVLVFLLQSGAFADILALVFHAIALVKLRKAVRRKAKRAKALFYRLFGKLAQSVFAVAICRVGVEVLKPHQVIFSCFTFLSMTWREASSARTSSRDMPASTINTIRWYKRSEI